MQHGTQDPRSGFPNSRSAQGWLIWLFLGGLLLIMFLYNGPFRESPAAEINYSTFRNEVKQGNVERVIVQGERIEGELNLSRSRAERGRPRRPLLESSPTIPYSVTTTSWISSTHRMSSSRLCPYVSSPGGP